jgi:hypothetical protein
MSIAAANVAPSFIFRRSIDADDLKRLQEPAVIFEHHGIDDDGASFFVYTVAGWIDGENIATQQGGATVGGDVIVIHADDRPSADLMAGLGLEDTINALHRETDQMVDAAVALERLRQVGPIERINQAIKPAGDMSDAFVHDTAKARRLVGDDIVLAAGRVE